MVPAGFLGWKLACDNLTAPGLRRGGVAPRGLAEQQGPCCRAEERANVYWNNHPDHSRDRAARGLFRYRRRAVLRDRLLWWRRPWTDHCYPADPAPVGTNLGDPTVTRPT